MDFFRILLKMADFAEQDRISQETHFTLLTLNCVFWACIFIEKYLFYPAIFILLHKEKPFKRIT